MNQSWQHVDAFIGRVEKALIVILLSAMVLIAFGQIVLRNAFATGISWGEPLVRYLVLWVGFIGAALATREGKHITIELFSVWKGGRRNRYFAALSDLCSTAICGLLTLAAVKFVVFESQMGSDTFFDAPIWLPELIIPLIFAVMTIRYLMKTLAGILPISQPGKLSGPQGDS